MIIVEILHTLHTCVFKDFFYKFMKIMFLLIELRYCYVETMQIVALNKKESSVYSLEIF